jgi:hypothetical protein
VLGGRHAVLAEPLAADTRTEQSGDVTNARGSAPADQESLARAFVLGLVAGLMLVVGALLIYAFGAGYFGDFAVPTPLNFIAAPLLLLGLLLVLWRFVTRRV